jgi:hypothetical protein
MMRHQSPILGSRMTALVAFMSYVTKYGKEPLDEILGGQLKVGWLFADDETNQWWVTYRHFYGDHGLVTNWMPLVEWSGQAILVVTLWCVSQGSRDTISQGSAQDWWEWWVVFNEIWVNNVNFHNFMVKINTCLGQMAKWFVDGLWFMHLKYTLGSLEKCSGRIQNYWASMAPNCSDTHNTSFFPHPSTC